MPVTQYMNGKVFTITGHLRGASENHSKLPPHAHIGSNYDDQWYHIVGALARWNFMRAVIV